MKKTFHIFLCLLLISTFIVVPANAATNDSVQQIATDITKSSDGIVTIASQKFNYVASKQYTRYDAVEKLEAVNITWRNPWYYKNSSGVSYTPSSQYLRYLGGYRLQSSTKNYSIYNHIVGESSIYWSEGKLSQGVERTVDTWLRPTDSGYYGPDWKPTIESACVRPNFIFCHGHDSDTNQYGFGVTISNFTSSSRPAESWDAITDYVSQPFPTDSASDLFPSSTFYSSVKTVLKNCTSEYCLNGSVPVEINGGNYSSRWLEDF